jgi:hypothetical protein
MRRGGWQGIYSLKLAFELGIISIFPWEFSF